MKIKKAEVIGIVKSFDEVLKASTSPKVAYAIIKNKRKLQPEIDAITEARQKLFVSGQEICKKYADKDEKGNPKKVLAKVGERDVEQWDIPEDKAAEFEAEFEEKQAPMREDIKSILDEEVEIEEHKIDMSLLENDSIPGSCIEAIFDFIKE